MYTFDYWVFLYIIKWYVNFITLCKMLIKQFYSNLAYAATDVMHTVSHTGASIPKQPGSFPPQEISKGCNEKIQLLIFFLPPTPVFHRAQAAHTLYRDRSPCSHINAVQIAIHILDYTNLGALDEWAVSDAFYRFVLLSHVSTRVT